jgi:hypothetical protein
MIFGRNYVEHRIFVSFFSILLVWHIFLFVRHLRSYGRNTLKNAYWFSHKVSVIFVWFYIKLEVWTNAIDLTVPNLMKRHSAALELLHAYRLADEWTKRVWEAHRRITNVLKYGHTKRYILTYFKLVRVSIKLVLFATCKLYSISHNACLDIVFVFDELWEIAICRGLLSGLQCWYPICEFNHTMSVLPLLSSRINGLEINVP